MRGGRTCEEAVWGIMQETWGNGLESGSSQRTEGPEGTSGGSTESSLAGTMSKQLEKEHGVQEP